MFHIIIIIWATGPLFFLYFALKYFILELYSKCVHFAADVVRGNTIISLVKLMLTNRFYPVSQKYFWGV